MSKTLLIVITLILVLVLIGSVPVWPHSVAWGYGPSAGALIIIILLIALLLR